MGDSSSDDEQQRAENGGPEDRETFVRRHNDLWANGVKTGDMKTWEDFSKYYSLEPDPVKRQKIYQTFIEDARKQHGHHELVQTGAMTNREATTMMLRNWLNPKISAFVDAHRNFSSANEFQTQFINEFDSWQIHPAVAYTIKEYYQQHFIDPLIEQRQMDNHHRSFPIPREFARPEGERAPKRQKTRN